MPDSEDVSSTDRLRRWLPGAGGLRRRWAALVPRLRARARWVRRKLRGDELSDTLDALDESYVREGAQSVTDSDLDTVVEEADAIEERFRNHGPLRRLLQDGRLLLGLIRDVRRGRYRQVPVWSISAAAFTLLYVLNPFDVIPEAIPVLGVLDDAAVVSACLALLEQDLEDYRQWRRGDEAREVGPSTGADLPARGTTDAENETLQ
jgi:uncharacterized membrane protein YkvA (DUF1232 family)